MLVLCQGGVFARGSVSLFVSKFGKEGRAESVDVVGCMIGGEGWQQQLCVDACLLVALPLCACVMFYSFSPHWP